MKTLSFALVTALSSLPAIASADAVLIRGDGALLTFEHLSADGCVHTVGELALFEGSEGAELADGVYITGSREDTCAGTGMGFAQYAEGSFRMLGLFYARYQGTVVAESYSGGDPVTFEIDLTWLGKGRVTRERNVFQDDAAISFTFSSRRDANTRGTLFADGVAMTVTSAQLVHETNGSLNL